MTEHRCERLPGTFYRIAYEPATPCWRLVAHTRDHSLANSPVDITHCPFCGEHLEIPELDITLALPASEWRRLQLLLNLLLRCRPERFATNDPTEPLLVEWIDRLAAALRESRS